MTIEKQRGYMRPGLTLLKNLLVMSGVGFTAYVVGANALSGAWGTIYAGPARWSLFLPEAGKIMYAVAAAAYTYRKANDAIGNLLDLLPEEKPSRGVCPVFD